MHLWSLMLLLNGSNPLSRLNLAVSNSISPKFGVFRSNTVVHHPPQREHQHFHRIYGSSSNISIIMDILKCNSNLVRMYFISFSDSVDSSTSHIESFITNFKYALGVWPYAKWGKGKFASASNEWFWSSTMVVKNSRFQCNSKLKLKIKIKLILQYKILS